MNEIEAILGPKLRELVALAAEHVNTDDPAIAEARERIKALGLGAAALKPLQDAELASKRARKKAVGDLVAAELRSIGIRVQVTGVAKRVRKKKEPVPKPSPVAGGGAAVKEVDEEPAETVSKKRRLFGS